MALNEAIKFPDQTSFAPQQIGCACATNWIERMVVVLLCLCVCESDSAENHLGQEHEHESMGHMLMENNDDDDDNGTLDFHFNCAKRDIDWYSAATTNEPHWFLPTAWAMVWLE